MTRPSSRRAFFKKGAVAGVLAIPGLHRLAHACASVPNRLVPHWQIYFHRNPMFEEIVDFEGPMVADGHIPLSEKPGIGVAINEEGMRKYAQPGVPFFE